ncbi:SOS response-associated peptidase, partial [Acinetobacter baumannii]|uniref:SOS response-associated peptidase n=1 Tax=Acinetobacter baumannii TaxID=470 RepID=UPI000AEFC64A
MCANFKPLKKEHSYQLDLLEPTFDYKSDVYPSDDCPIILSHQNEWEWRKVKFGMLPPYAKEVSFKYATYNARTETVDHKRSLALLHKDLKVKTSHIYSNLSDNSGM